MDYNRDVIILWIIYDAIIVKEQFIPAPYYAFHISREYRTAVLYFSRYFSISSNIPFLSCLPSRWPGWKINIHNCISGVAAHRHARDSSDKKLVRQTNKFKLNRGKLPRAGRCKKESACRRLLYRLLARDVKKLESANEKNVSIVKYLEHDFRLP